MNQEQVIQILKNKGITLSDKQIQQFELYYQTLIEWNEKMNLTAITQKEDVYLKHFYDSLKMCIRDRLYIRVADYTMKKCCGIYEIINDKGRKSYKIFASQDDLLHYLKKNTDKTCQTQKPLFSMNQYHEYPNTQVRRLTYDEVQNYLKERCI